MIHKASSILFILFLNTTSEIQLKSQFTGLLILAAPDSSRYEGEVLLSSIFGKKHPKMDFKMNFHCYEESHTDVRESGFCIIDKEKSKVKNSSPLYGAC